LETNSPPVIEEGTDMKDTAKKMSAQKKHRQRRQATETSAKATVNMIERLNQKYRSRDDKRERLPLSRERLELLRAYQPETLEQCYPDGFYESTRFVCRDCGKEEIWTAAEQKWWYEERGGYADPSALRCLECRLKERERKAEARRVSAEGMARKLARQAQNKR
jgi:hypothetical protein